MLGEKPQHLGGCVGASGVSITARRVPAGPCVGCPVDLPELGAGAPIGQGLGGAAIPPPALVLFNLHGPGKPRLRPRHDRLAIFQGNRLIPGAMKYDCRHGMDQPRARRPGAHDLQCLLHIPGRPGRQAGMHPDGGEQIGIGLPHDYGSRPAPDNSPSLGSRTMFRIRVHTAHFAPAASLIQPADIRKYLICKCCLPCAG